MKKIVLTLCTMFLISSIGFGQKKEMPQVNLDNLLNETQFTNDNTTDLEMIWWMPSEYWEAVFSREKYMSPEEAKMIIDTLKEYVLVIVVKGKVGMFGGITYESREDILKSFNVYYNGSALKYMKDDSLDPDLKNFITIIGPMMKNMIGQMGENMQIFTYKNDKKTPINVYGKGNLSFELSEYKANADLPLASLIMEKQCPEDKKLFNGKWSYCPIHGKELTKQGN